jgi:cell division control protein 45
MDMDLKQKLKSKLADIAPEYGLIELTYPSFARCFGYKAQPLSAADAVEAVSALLDVAGGVNMEVEVEGARNGGEWFGAGRVWAHNKDKEDIENVQPSGKEDEEKKELQWWVRNFWSAFDALTE